MDIKILILALLVTVNVYAKAKREVELTPFDIPVTAPTNLMQESTLKLDSESTVQEIAPRSDLTFGMLGGNMRFQRVTLDARGKSINYDFTKKDALPLLTAQFAFLPFAYKWGKLGLVGSVGYTYGEYYQGTVTSLHMLPVELSAIYKLDLKYSQFVIPYVSYGRQSLAIFQRGIDQYNTSENFEAWVAGAGLAFNLSRLKIFSSRNEMEVVFQYKKTFAPSTVKSDVNSQIYQVGGAFSL